MATPTTSVADDNRHAVTADVAWLVAGTAYDVTKWTTVNLRRQARLGALASYVARNITEIADRIIRTLTSKVARFAAVVTGLVVGAVGSDVAWPVAVVAEPGVIVRQATFRTVTGQMACFITIVADRLITAFTSHVSRLFTVPAQGLSIALCCNVPWKSTVVTDSHI